MNKTNRFRLLILLIGAVAALALAACGGGGSEKTTPAAATTTDQPSKTASATATPSPTSTPSPVPTPTPYNGLVMRIQVPKLGIDAPIEDLDVSDDGQMASPAHGHELTHVGWYYEWDKPGRLNPANTGWVFFGGKTQMSGFLGNSVFSAHVYYNLGVPAPFQRLKQATEGDEIIVTMEDGRKYTYEVISKAQYHRDEPFDKVVWPKNKPDNEEWITLITCGGTLDSTGVEYLFRDVVVARRKA